MAAEATVMMEHSDGKRVYAFDEGNASMKAVLGGKGANLAEMARIGLPVPHGFTITAQECIRYKESGTIDEALEADVMAAVADLEDKAGRKLGSSDEPLLVSVRSGAAISMPGMMDTVLNLGLNDATVEALAAATKDARFAYDCYRRFITMFADVVRGLSHAAFEGIYQGVKQEHSQERGQDLSPEAMRDMVARMKALYEKEAGEPFPQDPKAQLLAAVEAVFKSWETPRAVTYRRLNKIPDDMGTAVNVQMMVFGNMGDDCATGVAFTRDPSTGDKQFFGEFLLNAQGEDVVAGIRTPLPAQQMEDHLPDAYNQLVDIAQKLEAHFHDMQDLEFTVMQGKLWMLQTRMGKRTGLAAVKIALDMLDEGIIGEEEAVLRVDPKQLDQLLRPVFDPAEKAAAAEQIIAKGLNAGPGAASGRVVFSADDAVAWKNRGEQVILVREETSPEDIHGMDASEGFLTARGGMTSHAALVARQMGKVCVAGCSKLRIDYDAGAFGAGDRVVKEGDWISLDGFTGEVILGNLRSKPSEVVQVLVEGELAAEDAPVFRMFDRLMALADRFRTMKVRANADQPDQAEASIALGAQGIGLCRTEHMFFGPGKIEHVREMILAKNEDYRRKALKKLLPIQRKDFEGLFRAMGDRPVTIRLLDPPLHEFLPHEEKEQRELALMMNLSHEQVVARIDALRESNPMLGHRGCRLGITYPEITEMQARAILEAAVKVAGEGVAVQPEIMIPIVGHASEFRNQEAVVRRVAQQVLKESGADVAYLVGTMIELPRAALTADEIAESAEFFSFGTNDLTQTTLGVSRDDAGGFLTYYQENGLIPHDPFQTIDFAGTGQLVKIGTERGRQTRPDLKVGICGEHGGDPESVEFCHQVGLDYVSCSPFRLPIARLAAARAALRAKTA